MKKTSRAAASLAVAVLVLQLLPSPADAYPGTAASFSDGASAKTVSLVFPPRAQLAGGVSLLSNATVESAYLQLSGEAYSLPANFTHTGLSGFPSGTNDSGLAILPTGLSLALRNGSVEFSGPSLDFGTFSGTVRVADAVVLQGTSGTYTSPDIAWNSASYGHLIANVAPGLGAWSASFDIVNSTGALLQANVKPGGLITVDGRQEAPIRVRGTLSAPTPNDSPGLKLLGAGYVLSDYLQTTAASRATANLAPYSGALELRESLYNITEFSGNPVMGAGPPGSWWQSGPLAGSTVQVGRELWMYITALDGSVVNRIGRMVSADGGSSWTVDGSPVLNPTAATWDSAYVGIPSVLYDGTTFRMWYMGASVIDQFRIGYATSTDGVTWSKSASNPVLSVSGAGWDNWAVGWPNVVKAGSTYYLFFSARSDADARKSTGYATSTDGVSWAKYASNPVIAWGSTTFGSYEAVASEAVYENGVFYLYWTCASSASAYDTCLSTSTNAASWTHFSGNPIITHGDGAWDSLTAELATRTVDPVSGRTKLFFTGRPGTPAYSLGRADPRRETPGSYVALWNLTGERPHAFLSHVLSVSAPAGTSTAPSIRVSANNISYSAAESVSTNDAVVVSAPDVWLKHTINMSTSDTRNTPVLYSSRIAYDRYTARGVFVSAALPAPYPIANATVTLAALIPANTSLALWVSNDDGATWVPAASGARVDFSAPGLTFRYRVALNATSSHAPLVTMASGVLGVDSTPADVEVRGTDGSLIASLAGDLLAPVAVSLDPAYFNTRIAPAASSDPPIPVDFELWVNASTAGIVHLDAVRFNLTFPDLLRTYFAPDAAKVTVEEGDAQNFRVVASTTPGVPITYHWELDNATSPQTGELFTFFAAPGTAGNHTVLARASNGQFTASKTWQVEVLPKPVYLAVAFYPGVRAIEVPAGLLQQFFAAAVSALLPPSITWTLDGRVVGTDFMFNFTAPALPGSHALLAVVTNGQDTLSWQWDITVSAVPEAASRQLDVTFAPPQDVTLAVNGTQTFSAAFAGAAPPGVHYEWRLSGAPVGADASSYSFAALSSLVGSHALTVLVRNQTAIAAHSWILTVLPPPPPAPPSVSFTSPSDNFSTNVSTITAQGTASPGATVSVNGVEAAVDASGDWSVEIPLGRGTNVLTAIARNVAGLQSSAAVRVIFQPPSAPPSPETVTREATISPPSGALILALGAALAAVTLLFLRERKRRAMETVAASPTTRTGETAARGEAAAPKGESKP